MRLIKLLSVLAFTASLLTGPALAEEKKTCPKAGEAPKKCCPKAGEKPAEGKQCPKAGEKK